MSYHDEDTPRHWECVECGRTFFTEADAEAHERRFDHHTEVIE